jgi:hypothetical protein
MKEARVLEELKKLVRGAGANYTDDELMRAISGEGSIRCDMMGNWTIRKDQNCLRANWCKAMGEKTENIRCAVCLVKTAWELRKRYWVDEDITDF